MCVSPMAGSGPASVGTIGGQEEETQRKEEEHEDPAGVSRLHLSRRRGVRLEGKKKRPTWCVRVVGSTSVE